MHVLIRAAPLGATPPSKNGHLRFIITFITTEGDG
jgi:hypothetical protein